MKKFFQLVLIMFVLYLGIQVIFYFFSNNHEISYDINGLKVKELFKSNDYYLEIQNKNDLYNIKVPDYFNKTKKILLDTKVITGNKYNCIFLSFKNDINYGDIICKEDKIIYHYKDIKGQDKLLDEQIKNLDSYDINKFIDKEEYKEYNENEFVYTNNIVKDYYLGIKFSNGIRLINNYSKDKYLYTTKLYEKRPNSRVDGFVGRYYISAGSSIHKNFTSMEIVDLVLGTTKTVNYHSSIYFDSYIMGSVNNKLYLFDNINLKQYEIDPYKKTIIEVGNKEIGVKYYNKGIWTNKNITSDSLSLKFNYIDKKDGYDRVDYIEKQDEIIYYKKSGDIYKVYKSYKENESLKTYLFETDNINDIIYCEDYIYYVDNNTIKYYHDDKNVRKLYSSYDSILYNVIYQK